METKMEVNQQKSWTAGPELPSNERMLLRMFITIEAVIWGAALAYYSMKELLCRFGEFKNLEVSMVRRTCIGESGESS